ncbi:MAG: DNA polymerase domain-containing protein, partial [Bacteroidota bacterium]
PSIMLSYGVQPKSDALGLFPRLLRRLTDLRFEAKAAMRATEADERAELDARQNAYKNVINSFYGNMGFGYALFNDFAEADRVAATGQDLLRQIIRLARDAGAQIVEVDTDGVLFVPPRGVDGEAAERAFVEALSQQMPDGIRIGFDGRFRRMLSYKKKNYALLGYDGALTFKGSSLVSRSSERFGRRFVRDAIRRLLDEDIQGLHDLYLRYRRQIEAHDWAAADGSGVESFQRVETLKASLDAYERAVAAGERTRAAAYEVARREAERTGRAPRLGDRVAYYIAEGGGRVFEAARLADAWDPEAPDESTPFYLDRLDQLAARFAPFFETEAQFRLVFSEEDLFGFDPSGVRLVVRERDPEEVEDDVPF